MAKQVAVFGAGTAGLVALKSCLEEGLQPVCYERRDDLGGLWCYKKHEKASRARAYESLITNGSKEASCFSDFPYPEDYPPFITHTQHLKYLKSYADHFDLWKCIVFDTEIENVVEQNPREGRRRWKVSIRNLTSNLQYTKEYDAIIVCTGLHTKPLKPEIDGLLDDTFSGKVLHSCEYDVAEDYKGKQVVVIGLGNSAADIAVDVSSTASKTILSTRSGAWIVPRVFKKGLPPDMTLTTRVSTYARNLAPAAVLSWIGKKLLSTAFDLTPLGLRSRYPPTNQKASLLVNDELPAKVVSGKIAIKPGVLKFDSSSAHFTDGTKEDVDVVICATGYTPSFSFFGDDILPAHVSEMKLFEWIFPFELADPSSLAIVGLIAISGGSVFPTMECQSRYAAQIIAGIRDLPPPSEMRKAFEKERRTFVGHGKTFRFRRPLGIAYQDRLATLGGFYPGFWKTFFRDPKLALAVYTGPYTSYHYRLQGRHTWDKARHRILNVIPYTLSGINPKYRSLNNG